MRTLILLRHAKSDYPPGVADHERPLSERGVANARTIAGELRTFLPGSSSVGVAVSTARRARETWSAVATDLPRVDRRWDDAALYLAEPEEIAEVTQCFDTDIGIVVGHNPGLEVLARSYPAADADIDLRLRTKFPTAAFAVIANDTCEAFVTCR